VQLSTSGSRDSLVRPLHQVFFDCIIPARGGGG